MVVINVKVNNEDKPLYMDGTLYERLNSTVIPAVQKKDFDWFFAIDGQEGSGKSVFAFQVAKVLDPDFTNEQIAFTSDQFVNLVVKAKKHQCIVFDEAFTGLSSRTSLSEVNNLMVSLMMEMRQKNLFIILVMPTFFMLDRYVVLHRARGLFHVYMRNGKRGYWNYYNKQKMKLLYLNGKKYYEYNNPKPMLFGRFQDQYTVDETEYRTMKKSSLHKKKRSTKADTFKTQRDFILYGVYKDLLNGNNSKLTRYCKKWDVELKRTTLSTIIKLIERTPAKKIQSQSDSDFPAEELGTTEGDVPEK